MGSPQSSSMSSCGKTGRVRIWYNGMEDTVPLADSTTGDPDLPEPDPSIVEQA
jgi:hypothetical protein